MQSCFLDDQYGVKMDLMTLDVHESSSTHSPLAIFNFGIIEGTMLLASSESLELIWEEQAVQSSDDMRVTKGRDTST
ncbi:hypothetical protein F5Y12DRAFT_753740 [Xylaria sp. FL1777]|nr:hypothetical protein F5Y12DRAFT_753740 [Xylaria sp. FL1777]